MNRVLALVFVMVGCGEDVKIPDTTKVLDDQTLASLQSVSSDLVSFTFANATPQLDALAEGDVIVADVYEPVLPAGTLRKVVGVDRTGPGVVVTTGPARLEDAVEQGSIDETRSLRMEDLVGVSGKATRAAIGPDGLYVGFDNVVIYDYDNDPSTTNDQVILFGNLAIEPDFGLTLKISNFSLKELTFDMTGELSANLNVEARREAKFGDSQGVLVTTLYFQPITFFIGPIPVVLQPSIAVYVGVDGKVTAKTNVGMKVDASARLGFGYHDGKIGPVTDFDYSGTLEVPSFADGAVAEARAFARTRLTVSAYGIAGGYVEARVYARALVDVAANPWWKLCAGVEGSAGLHIGLDIDIFGIDTGVHIDILDKELATIGPLEQCLADAGGPAPSVTSGMGTDGIASWARTYGGASTDFPVSLALTEDGGALVAGSSVSFDASPSDAWLIKTDTLGHVGWEVAFQDLGTATSAIDLADGYLVAAGRLGATTGPSYLLRLDDNGKVVWARSITSPNGTGIAKLLPTNDGGAIAVGTHGYGATADFFAARFDAQGALLWSRRYDSGGDDYAWAGTATSDGGFLIAGQLSAGGIWLMKIDGQGAINFQTRFDGTDFELGTFVAESPLGGYVVGGQQGGNALVIRLNTAGQIVWQRTYDGGTPYEEAYDVTVRADGEIVIVGKTDIYAPTNLWVLAISDGGNVDWSRSVGGPAQDFGGGAPPYGWAGSPIRATPDGGVLVAGHTESFGAGGQDAWLLKLTKNGYLALDSATGAYVTPLSGSVSNTGLAAISTTALPIDLPLGVIDVAVVARTTNATVMNQGLLP